MVVVRLGSVSAGVVAVMVDLSLMGVRNVGLIVIDGRWIDMVVIVVVAVFCFD